MDGTLNKAKQRTMGLGFNERRVLAALRAQGPRSRADLARGLALTPSTLTRLTGALIEAGVLYEESDPVRSGQKGFPAKLVKIAARGIHTAGVYLDPDRIMTCVSDLAGEVRAHEEVPVTDRSFAAIMTAAGQSVARLIDGLGLDVARVAGCGVSYPGQYTGDPAHVFRIRQFADWPAIDVGRDLAPFFGMPVRHMNDAKAACLAELYHGACTDVPTFCHIWLSYGIGGAAVVRGQPWWGRMNGAAEWGGLFPKSSPRPSGQDLFDTLVAAGVPVERLTDIAADHLAHPAGQAWQDRATEQLRWLCLVIARTYAPDAIVIGGTLPPALLSEMVARIAAGGQLGEDHLVPPPRLLRAERDLMPQMGAAALPLHHAMNPETYTGQARKGW